MRMDYNENNKDYDFPNNRSYDYTDLSAQTISLGDLLSEGFELSYEDMGDLFYSDKVRQEFSQAFQYRFWYREISMMPPEVWDRRLTALLLEIMPKYNAMFKNMDFVNDNLFSGGNTKDKSRIVFSEYPQAQINGNNDYASNGTDREGYKEENVDPMKRYNEFMADFRSILSHLLDELEVLFSQNIRLYGRRNIYE